MSQLQKKETNTPKNAVNYFNLPLMEHKKIPKLYFGHDCLQNVEDSAFSVIFGFVCARLRKPLSPLLLPLSEPLRLRNHYISQNQ